MGQVMRGEGVRFLKLEAMGAEARPSFARIWRLAIRAIKWAWQISLDFCSRMLYPTLDGS